MTPQIWVEEPSPDRHLCIHEGHQNRCEHFRPPIYPDDIITCETIDDSSAFMSLQDLEDMNILADIDFSSDDELPDFI